MTTEPTSPSQFEYGVTFEVFDCGWQVEHRGGFETREARDSFIRTEPLRRPKGRVRNFVPIKRRIGAWGPDQ